MQHEAYIWQRVWTTELVAAVEANQPGFHAWRVLALQQRGRTMLATTPRLEVLAATAMPVWMVLRIEGSRPPPKVEDTTLALRPLLDAWRAAGIALAGVEVDHDCAEAGLEDYAVWIAALRQRMPEVPAWSITALPSWIGHGGLPRLLAEVERSVLQVHAVDRPAAGLFDPDRALAWAQAYGRLGRPFHLALPAYGLRVALDRDQGVLAVDGEGLIDRSGSAARELRVDPRELERLLQRLRAEPPAGLVGLLWFRLPSARDRRAMSIASLAALTQGQALRHDDRLELRSSAPGLLDLWLHREGTLDGAPPRLRVAADCTLAEGLGTYQREVEGDIVYLQPGPSSWLRAGRSLHIGWARCQDTTSAQWELQ